MTIGFVGLDHLGVISSLTAARNGYKIITFDSNKETIDTLNRNLVPFYEPQLQDLLIEQQKNIKFTNEIIDIENCEIVFISADIKDVDQEIENLIEITKEVIWPNTILVIMSQVAPGFTRKINHPKKNLFYQAEILIVGNSVERSIYPEQIIIGAEDSSQSLPSKYHFYLEKFNSYIKTVKYESAEMAKISINAMLAAQVSMTNILAQICENTEANWNEIQDILYYDSRIGAYTNPGLGLSGGHLERDLNTLSKLIDSDIIQSIKDHGIKRRGWVNRILYDYNYLDNDPLICIWGLSYKPGTDSTKNSASIFTINYLHGNRKKVYDPHVLIKEEDHLKQVNTASDALLDADILLILTPHEEFNTWCSGDIEQYMKGKVIIDPYGVLNRKECLELGFKYHQLGVKFNG